MLIGSLDQWAVKFRVSFGWLRVAEFVYDVLETQARSARTCRRFKSTPLLLFHCFRGSSEFFIQLPKLKS